MLKTYSIAKARDQFTEVVRQVESEAVIQLTRRGKLVALLLSPEEYNRLQNQHVGFWEAFAPFRQQIDEQAADTGDRDISVDEIFAGVRDQTPGRAAEW